MSLIISAALTVNLLNLLFGFLAVIAADLHGIVDAGFLVSPDVNSQHIGSVSKDKIRTPSDDDAGSFFICQVLYDLCLEVEKIFLRGKIGSFRSDNITVIDLYLFKKSRLCFFVSQTEKSLVYAAVLGGKLYKILVIIGNGKLFAEHFADGASAAAEFSCYCNYKVVHDPYPFFIGYPHIIRQDMLSLRSRCS